MTPERYREVGQVYRAALEVPHEQRAAYLKEACGDDHALRQDVESLLVHESEDHGWIDGRALDIAAEALAAAQSQSWVGRQVGHYQVFSLVGSGGMGEVYRARDARLGRDVALKVLPVAYSTNPEWLRRFEREARAAGQLNHPNVLTVYDVGVHEQAPYIVAELLEGEDLRKLLNKGAIPQRRALDFGRQIANGLAAAHAKNVVHRDLKPENLFITTDGRVKILDFGIAKLKSPASGGNADTEGPTGAATIPGTVLGTVGYMSPEQVRGMEADHRSDIFVFGAILYEMLSGSRPFQGESGPEVLHGILKIEPADLSERNPTIPLVLARLVHRCLEKTPERRFQSAGDLSFALDALASLSTPAGGEAKPGAVTRIRTFPRNIVLGAVAVAAAFAAAVWLPRMMDDPWQPLLSMSFKSLTNTEGDEWGAEISSDGQLVAFLDRDGPFDPWDVWVTQFGGGPFNNLTKGVAMDLGNPRIRNLKFSHDGRQIVMEAKKDGEIHLWAVSALGGSLRKFRDEANEIAFSRDGSRMVYHDDAAGDPMFVTDSEGVGRQIYTAPQGVHCHFQVWSPDDAFIYFVQGLPPDKMDIWRIPSSPGGVPEQVTFHNSLVAYPTFINDRMLLYIARNPDGSGPSLYGVDVRRRLTRRITFGVEQYTSIASSAGGRRLVATVANPVSNLWRMPISNKVAEESEATRVTLSTVQGLSPRWTHDGLLYLSSRSGDNGIWKFANGTSTEVRDGSEGRVLSAAVDVGGGSSRIAAVIEKDRHAKLYIMNPDGTGIRPLGDSVAIRGAPSWSPDGQWITVAVDEGAGPRVFKFSPDGRSVLPMTTEYAINPVWSPDGRFLVYAGAQLGTSFRLHAITKDGQPHFMPEMTLDLGATRFSFVPGTSSLVFLKGGLWNKNLWMKDLQTGGERQLTNLSREFLTTDFDVSLDGREIVFSRQKDNSDVVVIVLPQL
jgi:Tol biopolymer transport system component